jgi:hypothetical protein
MAKGQRPKQALMWRRHSCLRASRSDALHPKTSNNEQGHGAPCPCVPFTTLSPSATRRQECLRHTGTSRLNVAQTLLSARVAKRRPEPEEKQ